MFYVIKQTSGNQTLLPHQAGSGNLFWTWFPHGKSSVKLTIGFVIGFVNRFRHYKPEESLNAILTFFLCLLAYYLVYYMFIICSVLLKKKDRTPLSLAR